MRTICAVYIPNSYVSPWVLNGITVSCKKLTIAIEIDKYDPLVVSDLLYLFLLNKRTDYDNIKIKLNRTVLKLNFKGETDKDIRFFIKTLLNYLRDGDFIYLKYQKTREGRRTFFIHKNHNLFLIQWYGFNINCLNTYLLECVLLYVEQQMKK